MHCHADLLDRLESHANTLNMDRQAMACGRLENNCKHSIGLPARGAELCIDEPVRLGSQTPPLDFNYGNKSEIWFYSKCLRDAVGTPRV